jgi:hypothetical protein
MPSFISNSKQGRSRRRRDGKTLAVFAGAFLVLVLAGGFAAGRMGTGRVWRGEMAPFPEKGCILNQIDSDHFDVYDELYYGIGPAVENARKADILLLGNSRVLFAFRAPSVRAFEARTGLRVFNLCFPANDGLVMAWEAIRRNGLRPAVVVVNENQFFNRGISPYGVETLQEGRWGAFSRVAEDRMSWDSQLALHRILPRFGFGNFYPAVPAVTYQSSLDGCLLFENFSRSRRSYPIRETGALDEPSAGEAELAEKFKAFLESRGARMVLTDIPYDMETYVREGGAPEGMGALYLAPENLKPFRKAVKLSRETGVPLVEPSLEGLRTLDGSHLTAESAERFARGFFGLFGKLEDVRRLEGQGRRPTSAPGTGKP